MLTYFLDSGITSAFDFFLIYSITIKLKKTLKFLCSKGRKVNIKQSNKSKNKLPFEPTLLCMDCGAFFTCAATC